MVNTVNSDCAVCWFQVFDVVLNGEHTIVSELDIFGRVGRGVAHDEVVPFSIKGGKLRVSGEQSQIDGCLLYTSPSPRDDNRSRMPSSA